MSQAVLQFLGGAGTVTGSRFLVETDASRVLVDAGLFQGLRRHRRQNWEPFPIDPSRIDVVAITHAHIDHSGYAPALVSRGFNGPIACSERTAELCRILWPDAAHLQEEEAKYANARGFSKHQPALPLFTGADAEAAMDLLEPIPFDSTEQLTTDVAATFHPAGHILGSSSILLEVGHEMPRSRVLFSGDLGRGDHPILRDPPPPPDADVVLIESTYGDRQHPDPSADVERLVGAVNEAASRGGMVLIPAFAVDRTEVVLLLLRNLMGQARIPKLPVYADSPMALRVLDIYRAAGRAGDADVRPVDHETPFDPGGGLHECHTPDESRSLANLTFPSIIVSASGMATGGRVLHHLERLLPDPRNAVVLSGFQAAGTRGRALADGASKVKMLGNYVPVRATVVAMESLSVHADADDLTTWLGSMAEPPATTYVVHGEPDASAALAERLSGDLDLLAVAPRQLERVLLEHR